jgi:formylglycine-generating enzyme required for sulfatase activity
MGSAAGDAGHRDDELPVRVTLHHGFWLGDTEVTQQLYESVAGSNPSTFKGPALPVESVSWEDAQAFLQRLNAVLPSATMRLPTEAEWEYAARAGGGSSTPAQAWSARSSSSQTHPVGTLPPNSWGLHDLLGNVMEWCQDYYMPYPTGAVADPVGWQGINRVARGGAWTMTETDLRIAARTKYLPVTRFFFLGFRIASTEP